MISYWQPEQVKYWTRPEIQFLLDRTLDGMSISSIQDQLFREFHHVRHRDEYVKCLALDGPARKFYPGIPIYWDHNLEAELLGEAVDDDTSELTRDEVEELIIYLDNSRSGIDPSKFKHHRSSAFLSAELEKLEDTSASVWQIAVANIRENRMRQEVYKMPIKIEDNEDGIVG